MRFTKTQLQEAKARAVARHTRARRVDLVVTLVIGMFWGIAISRYSRSIADWYSNQLQPIVLNLIAPD